MTTKSQAKTGRLLHILILEAKRNGIKFNVRKVGNYQYYITFQQPWFIQRIEANMDNGIIESFSV